MCCSSSDVVAGTPGVRSCVCRGVACRHGAHFAVSRPRNLAQAHRSVTCREGRTSVGGSFAGIDAAIACAALRALPQQRASFMRRLIARFSRLFLNSGCFRQGKCAGHGTVQAWHGAGVCACGRLLPRGMQSSCCSELLRDCATSPERWCAGYGVASRSRMAARRAWDWRRRATSEDHGRPSGRQQITARNARKCTRRAIGRPSLARSGSTGRPRTSTATINILCKTV